MSTFSWGRVAHGPRAWLFLAVDADALIDCRDEKDLQIAGLSGLSEAAEGIRTLDLLHGTQLLRRRRLPRYPCKWAGSLWRAPADDPRLSPRDHWGLGTESGLGESEGGRALRGRRMEQRRLEALGAYRSRTERKSAGA
jgi:hypothetical protein